MYNKESAFTPNDLQLAEEEFLYASSLETQQHASSLQTQNTPSLPAQDTSSHEIKQASPLQAQLASSLHVQNTSLLQAQNSSSLHAKNTSSLHAQNSSSLQAQDTSRFAYVFLMAGCDPTNPNYLGYIYNIMISKRMLVERGSTQDVLILVRMHAKVDDTVLPAEQESMLSKTGVKIKYLPKPEVDNFHTAMMDKFRILTLTEYERVIFLDSDVLPIWNLDYMFEKSVGENATIEENVILAYKGEPANGGFFMLKPDKEDYKEVLALIDKTQSSGYHFNETLGWGHVITPPDAWVPYKGENGTEWNWHGAFSDQGLLYYWTKYHKKKVSIIIKDKIQKWGSNEKGDSVMVSEIFSKNIFGKPKKFILSPGNHHKGDHPYCDFEHFVQTFKPWLPMQARNPPDDVKNIDDSENTKVLWYHLLRKLNKELELGINVENLKIGRPSLGLFPTNEMVQETLNAKTSKKF